MKKIIILELCLMLFATTFKSDKMTGWIQQTIPRPDIFVRDLQFLDSLTGFLLQQKNLDTAFIFKTTDGGNNWITSVFPDFYLTSLYFVDKDIGYLAGGQHSNSNAIVYKTTNSGQNWILLSPLTTFLFLDDVFFVNKDTGFVCSSFFLESAGLWRTVNGGSSWQKQLYEDVAPQKIFFIDRNTGWAINYNGTNLYKTINSGINWFSIAQFSSNTISDVFFVSSDTGWIVGGGNNNLKRTTNGGINWSDVNIPTYLTSENRLYFIQNAKGWAGSAPYKIFTSKDGYNWGKQNSPIPSNFNIYFVDTSTGWAGYSGLVHTTDGGGAIVSVNNENNVTPEDFILEQNYPNPFNQSSIINYKCSIGGMINITVYDISGKEISVLVNEYKPAGSYSVNFSGSGLPSGIYFCRLNVDGKPVSTKKMILAK